jgi:hypothetical protein
MQLPADYPDIIAAGVDVLRSVGAQLRTEAAQRPKAAELWLAVRDVEGLAGRLADASNAEWRQGFMSTFMNGQDLGVLDELLGVGADAGGRSRVRGAQADSIARLRRFLQQYGDREFELDAPTA